MQEFLTIFLIGIGLSMDTFSVSLSIGTLNISNKQINIISLIVGIFHFVMPLLGLLLGQTMFKNLVTVPKYILSIILLVLVLKLIKDYFEEEEYKMNLSFIGILLFALSVSLDSFSTGIVLSTITSKILISTSMFSICSILFTYSGLQIGKYSTKKFGKISLIIGMLILIIVAILNLL